MFDANETDAWCTAHRPEQASPPDGRSSSGSGSKTETSLAWFHGGHFRDARFVI